MFRTGMLIAIRATVVTLVLTGIVYPLFTTAVALALFPGRARGSLVRVEPRSDFEGPARAGREGAAAAGAGKPECGRTGPGRAGHDVRQRPRSAPLAGWGALAGAADRPGPQRGRGPGPGRNRGERRGSRPVRPGRAARERVHGQSRARPSLRTATARHPLNGPCMAGSDRP